MRKFHRLTLLFALFAAAACVDNNKSVRNSIHRASSEQYGDGCKTFSITVKSPLNSGDFVRLSAIEFCTDLQKRDADDVVAKIRELLINNTQPLVRVQCDGVNGANKFVLLDEVVSGYRKICSESQGTCRHEFLYDSDSNWHKEDELFRRACNKISP